MTPRGCDTMVATGKSTFNGSTIFCKNSDRPDDEVQIVAYYPGKKSERRSYVRCTYTNVPQVPQTYSIIVCQPIWMYGAEMGVNENGVCIGNEAVWTKETYRQSGLLGMDLLRLGLERSKNSYDALCIIIKLLEEHNQGGNCSENLSMKYHNSFLICDHNDSYVLETADKFWCYEKVKKDTTRNISNGLTILGKGDGLRKGTISHCIKKKYIQSSESSYFQFAKAFTQFYHPTSRYQACHAFLEKDKGSITCNTMSNILKNHEYDICMHGQFLSTASQISVLSKDGMINYFTGTSSPCLSCFHPFTFSFECSGLEKVKNYDQKHGLWAKHKQLVENNKITKEKVEELRKLEHNNFANGMKFMNDKNEKIKMHNNSMASFHKILGIN